MGTISPARDNITQIIFLNVKTRIAKIINMDLNFSFKRLKSMKIKREIIIIPVLKNINP